MDDLAFFTNEELIRELMSRKTFMGFIFHCKTELREDVWKNGAKNFSLKRRNLTVRQIKKAVEYIHKAIEGA